MVLGCKNPSEADNRESVWENLNLPVESAYELAFGNGDLYVATGYDGLYFLQESDLKNEWKYLGHRRNEDRRYKSSGVRSLSVYQSEVVINSREAVNEENREVSVWKSLDKGDSWQPFDEGMQAEVQKTFWPRDIIRSPEDPQLLLAVDGTIFRNTEDIEVWDPVYPDRENPQFWDFTGSVHVTWNLHYPNEIWMEGISNREDNYIGWSTDAGVTWDFIYGGPVSLLRTLTFDAIESDVAYASIGGDFIKSLNRGLDWVTNDSITVFSSPGIQFTILESHTKLSGVLFGVSYFSPLEEDKSPLFISIDGGKSFTEINTPDNFGGVTDLLFSAEDNSLYVATTTGVFRFFNPLKLLDE